nr:MULTISPECIES: hypothetical protein [unclassified Oceanobacillus]
MLQLTWHWMWEKHDQVKDLFRLFVKPSEVIEKNKKMGLLHHPQRIIITGMMGEINVNITRHN